MKVTFDLFKSPQKIASANTNNSYMTNKLGASAQPVSLNDSPNNIYGKSIVFKGVKGIEEETQDEDLVKEHQRVADMIVEQIAKNGAYYKDLKAEDIPYLFAHFRLSELLGTRETWTGPNPEDPWAPKGRPPKNAGQFIDIMTTRLKKSFEEAPYPQNPTKEAKKNVDLIREKGYGEYRQILTYKFLTEAKFHNVCSNEIYGKYPCYELRKDKYKDILRVVKEFHNQDGYDGNKYINNLSEELKEDAYKVALWNKFEHGTVLDPSRRTDMKVLFREYAGLKPNEPWEDTNPKTAVPRYYEYDTDDVVDRDTEIFHMFVDRHS